MVCHGGQRSFLVSTWAVLATFMFLVCCRPDRGTDHGNDWRWREPSTYERWLNPGRPHLIQVEAGQYRPGARPQAVGPPLRAFR